MKTLKKFLLIVLILLLSAFLVAIGYYFSVTKTATLDEEKLLLPKGQICAYDQTGNKMEGGIGFDGRETVTLEKLSNHTKNAFVCVEDKRFYSHNGFDIRRIAKAMLNNLKSKRFSEGASTISQQLVKNTHLSLEKTVKRKLKEFKLTRALEQKYSKDEILELYLNTIYFGHSCYGLQNAANFYFGKDAAELNLAESALLAGLVRSPNNYSPFRSLTAATGRRKTVLRLMLTQNAITQKEYEQALNTPLPTASSENGGEYHYLRHALNELEILTQKHSLSTAGKIELYTYANPELQRLASELSKNLPCGVCIATVDNDNLGVTAFYSTVGEIRRSPASTIKPLAVYAPAIENGLLSPATPILDEAVDFGGYTPKNHDGKYRGYISAREALSTSLNIPAVKLLNTLGVENSAKTLQRLGLPLTEEDKTLALALGGVKNGYTLTELLSAYATFANDGKFAPCAFIRKISINGRTVYERKENQQVVFSPETAYLTTDMLCTCAQSGTAKKLRALPFSVAAKTGTTGSTVGNTDAYAISYTPLDTVGVWLGNADNSPMQISGGGRPTEISLSLHQALQKARGTIPEFERPYTVKNYHLDEFLYRTEQRVLLADQAAPAKHRFSELFWDKYAPKERSTLFSKPTLKTPQISLTEGGVRISLPFGSPDFYEYEIRRQTNGDEQILFYGKLKGEFLDKTAKEGETYEYSVIPYYDKTAGTPVRLPAVKTPIKIPREWWRN